MTRQFDWNRVGKRMPYTLPPDTFSQIETNVMATLQREGANRQRRRWMRWSALTTIAAAASVAFVFLLQPARTTTAEDLLLQVDMAYARLSEDDQALLLEMNDEDLFINPTQNE